jgi:hypothetical protein
VVDFDSHVAAMMGRMDAAPKRLPQHIGRLKVSQLTYQSIREALQIIAPLLLTCDFRDLWAIHNREGSVAGTQIAIVLWINECENDQTLFESKSANLFLCFCMANLEYTAIGSTALGRMLTLSDQQLSYAIKGSTQNAGIMYKSIFDEDLKGEKPKGCMILIAVGILIASNAIPSIFVFLG